MDRKAFLKQVCLAAGAGGFTVLTARSDNGQQPDAPKADPRATFAHTWVRALMENMEQKLGEKERVELMEECGRDCARRGSIAMAKQSQGNVDNLLAKLAGPLGPENARREGNLVFIGYDKCFCPLVSSVPEPLPASYCNCSRGWLKEMLETVTGKPVQVVLKQSIKGGAPNCRFEATIQA